MARKTAVITGANAGIGLALCERLLSRDDTMRLVLLCRNKSRAEAARMALKVSHPRSDVEIVICDTSSTKYVIAAATEIKQRYDHVDLLYLNAGVMPNPSLNIYHMIKTLFTSVSGSVDMFTTARGILTLDDTDTDEGLRQTFATNVMGHFVLVEELQEVLGGQVSSQVVWTGSSSADPRMFSLSDVQSRSGPMPYSSSKHLIDLISVETHARLYRKNVHSHVICPGTVMSNMTFGILPSWIWTLFIPIIYLLRICVPNFTRTPHHGAHVMEWVSRQDPVALDSRTRYSGQVSFFGREYVNPVQLRVDNTETRAAYEQLQQLSARLRLSLR